MSVIPVLGARGGEGSLDNIGRPSLQTNKTSQKSPTKKKNSEFECVTPDLCLLNIFLYKSKKKKKLKQRC